MKAIIRKKRMSKIALGFWLYDFNNVKHILKDVSFVLNIFSLGMSDRLSLSFFFIHAQYESNMIDRWNDLKASQMQRV